MAGDGKDRLEIMWPNLPTPAGMPTADRPGPYSDVFFNIFKENKFNHTTSIANAHLIKEPHITIKRQDNNTQVNQMKNMTRMLVKETAHGELNVHITLYVCTAHDSR